MLAVQNVFYFCTPFFDIVLIIFASVAQLVEQLTCNQ